MFIHKAQCVPEMELSKMIKHIRTSAGLSQERFADRIDVTGEVTIEKEKMDLAPGLAPDIRR